MCVQLLTPTQVARCIVQGWPYTPDTLAICSWVAAEDGDAGALAVLTAPNRSANTSGAAAWAPQSHQNGFAASEHNRAGRGDHLLPAVHAKTASAVLRLTCKLCIASICSLALLQSFCTLDLLQVVCSLVVVLMFVKHLQPCIFRLRLIWDTCVHHSAVCLTGLGSLPAGASGQNGDGHVNSLPQLPMSGPLTGSNDVQYNIGPSSSSQHHSGPQAWAINEAV